MARFNNLVESMSAAFDGLTDRERKLIILLSLALLVALVLASSWWMLKSISDKSAEIEQIRRQTQTMRDIEPDYLRAKEKQAQRQNRFRPGGPSLFTQIQNAANRVGVQLSNMNEQRAPMSESNLVETDVSLSVKQLSIDRLTAFLEAIEDLTQGGMAKVLRLRIRTRFDSPDLLDADMTVASWKSA